MRRREGGREGRDMNEKGGKRGALGTHTDAEDGGMEETTI